MAWLGGPRGKTGRRNPIVLHDPPPGYRPPRARMRQREARQDRLLMRVTTVVLVLAAAAFVVLMMVFIVTRM
jgi:hypothetical protein